MLVTRTKALNGDLVDCFKCNRQHLILQTRSKNRDFIGKLYSIDEAYYFSLHIIEENRSILLKWEEGSDQFSLVEGLPTNARSIRLQKAKELLESSDLNVSEVGYEVGFKNPSRFSSAYQEAFGIPPSKTRK